MQPVAGLSQGTADCSSLRASVPSPSLVPWQLGTRASDPLGAIHRWVGRSATESFRYFSGNRLHCPLEPAGWFGKLPGSSRAHGMAGSPTCPRRSDILAYGTCNSPLGLQRLLLLPTKWDSGFLMGSEHPLAVTLPSPRTPSLRICSTSQPWCSRGSSPTLGAVRLCYLNISSSSLPGSPKPYVGLSRDLLLPLFALRVYPPGGRAHLSAQTWSAVTQHLPLLQGRESLSFPLPDAPAQCYRIRTQGLADPAATAGSWKPSVQPPRITKHRDEHHLLGKNPHGCGKGKSCLTNLLEFF